MDEISIRMRPEAAVTRDLSRVTGLKVYEYEGLGYPQFERRGFDGGISSEGEESFTGARFEPLEPMGVEGCLLRELYPPKRHRLVKALGLYQPRLERLDPLHLALLSVYPYPTLDFQSLLSFPEGKALFPYQKVGVAFLIERVNALMADEMGLGKSIQAIVAARLLFKAGVIDDCLLLCPKSVLTDWAYKLEEWAPELKAVMICGSPDSRRSLWAERSEVYLVTYDTLKEDISETGVTGDGGPPSSFDLVILDEVQRIKNRSTETYKAVSRVEGHIRWGLSGTPLENRVEELTTIFSYLKPGLFHPYRSENPLYVKSSIQPFTLRRTKREVLKDLPEKTHEKVLLELGPRQREAYNLAERTGVVALKEKGRTATVTHVMALISKLKQICNLEPVSGESCKLEYLRDVLGNLEDTGEKMVVFSQYPEKTLKLIEPRLRRFHPLLYQGSLSSKQREEVLERFEEDEDARVLLMSLKAGGLGLTLTSANYVIHFDSWWNPAAMSQAEDRTHRIGQEKRVFVASLLTRGTIEERIQRILEEKRALFKKVVGGISYDGLPGLLSEEDLFGLFGLRRARRGLREGVRVELKSRRRLRR